MDQSIVQGSRGGCFSAVTRCFWGKPKEDLTRYRASERDTIEFEDIFTAEDRASVVQARKQMVTEEERQLLKSGKFDQLVEEQRRIDSERDAELRRQEEKLRQEEEAYYSAKREAARRTSLLSSTSLQVNGPDGLERKQSEKENPTPPPQVSLETERQPQSRPDMAKLRAPPTSLVTTLHSSSLPKLPAVSQMLSSSPMQDEDDFDQFLESVKARQLSITSKAPVGVSVTGEVGDDVQEEGGEEEEVDFGYWEKAELPASEPCADQETMSSGPPNEGASGKRTPQPGPLTRDMDLSLL